MKVSRFAPAPLFFCRFSRRSPGWMVICLLALWGIQPEISAATRTWQATSGSSWGSSSNWGGSAIGSGNDAVFYGAGTTVFNTYLGGSNVSINSLTFNSSASTSVTTHLWTSSSDTAGRVLTIGSGGISVQAGSHSIIGSAIVSGTHGDLRFSGNQTWNVASGAMLTLDARLSGNVSYTKTGEGTLVLSRNNGGGSGWVFESPEVFTVSAGTLRLAADGASGNSNNSFTVSSGATLELAAASAYISHGTTSGRGNLSLSGAGAGGVGALYASTSSTLASGTGATTLMGNTSIGAASGATLTIHRAISESGGSRNLTKVGDGVLELTGTNTYTGTTTVSAGTLVLSGGGSIANSAVVEVQSGATLETPGITFGAGQTVRGRGTIKGNVVLQGTLAPGNSPGILTFENDLTLASSTNSIFEIQNAVTPVRGTHYDGVNVDGVLAYDGALTLSLTSLVANGTYHLFDFGSLAPGSNFDSVVFSGGAYTGTFAYDAGIWTAADTNGSSQIFSFELASGNLIISVIPEPSAALLLTVGLMGVIFRRRRAASE